MRHIVGLTRASNQPPFHVYETESGSTPFVVGSKLYTEFGPDPGWLQITSLGYQVVADAIVTTVVLSDVTNVGGETEDFVRWPW